MSKPKSLQFKIIGELDLRPKMLEVWKNVNKGLEAGTVIITLSRPTRSGEQNRLLWSLLNELSAQVEWYGQKLSPEDWKNICTASLTKQSAVCGIDGGLVMIGASTSKMDKATFSNLLEVIFAFGAEQGVTFSDATKADYSQYREAQQ